MKTLATSISVALLLGALAVTPLGAQTNDAENTADTTKETTTTVVTNATDDLTNLAKPPVPPKAPKPAARAGKANGPVHIERPSIPFGGHHDDGFGALIAIVSIIAVFGMPIAIVGMAFYFRHRRNRMLHETVRLMVEKGTPIPPELFAGTARPTSANTPPRVPRATKDLRTGLILVGIGAGITIAVGKAGWIILLIGAALVVAWFIDSKNNTQSPQ